MPKLPQKLGRTARVQAEKKIRENGGRTIAIVQARMGSSRLPGKSMMPIMGRPMLWYLLERLGQVRGIEGIVVATTLLKEDVPILELAKAMGYVAFAGHVNDVLSRYHQAAKKMDAELIVRVCGDSPCIDPAEIDRLLKYRQDNQLDHSFLLDYPDGLDAEVFTMGALDFANNMAVQPSDREHVTPFIWRNVQNFYSKGMPCPIPGANKYRWTVDDEQDFAVVANLIENLHDDGIAFTLQQMVKYAQAHPETQQNQATQRNAGYIKSVEATGRRMSELEKRVLGLG